MSEISFKSKLGEYKVIQTQDNSITVHSGPYSENCHSTSGAKAETIYNYIEGCELERMNSTSEFSILEVGHGIGLGFICTLEFIKKNNSQSKLNFYSLEIDPELVEWSIENTYPHELKDNFQRSTHLGLDCFIFQSKLINYYIFIGDARVVVPKLKDQIKVDAIFQDAFSPKRNPTLWSWQWFKDLHFVATKDCLMTTYSASSSIRKSMIKAGWSVFNQKGFGPKRSMTKCKSTGASCQDVLDSLERSPVNAIDDSDVL